MALRTLKPSNPEIQSKIRSLTAKIENTLIEMASAGKVNGEGVMAALETSYKEQLDLFSLTKITYYSLEQLKDQAGAEAIIKVSDLIRKFSSKHSFRSSKMPEIEKSDVGFINEALQKREYPRTVSNWPDYAKEFRYEVLAAAYSAQPEITYSYLYDVVADRYSERRQEGFIFLRHLKKLSAGELVAVSNELFNRDEFDIYLRFSVVHRLAKSDKAVAVQHSKSKVEGFSGYTGLV